LEFADGGTLFLDEITEMSPMMQVKLLRFLEERVVEPVGSNQRLTLNVRVVAACNQNLKERMADGSFRNDLYYRLNVMEIKLPSLRERIGDLPLLVAHFLETDSGARKTEITREAIDALGAYRWPGNIRELRNAIDHALALSGGHPIRPEHLPEQILRPVSATPANDLQRLLSQFVDGVMGKHRGEDSPELYNLTVLECEKTVIRRALEESDWNQVQAAKLLGLHRNTLRKKIEDYNLAP
jgi:DNA-binding NtrC family response regulator